MSASTLTCRQCQAEFPRARPSGRPPAFCGADCRRAARTEDRADQRAAARIGPPADDRAPFDAVRWDEQRTAPGNTYAGSLVEASALGRVRRRPSRAERTPDPDGLTQLCGAGLLPDTWTARTSRSSANFADECRKLARASGAAAQALREVEEWLARPDVREALSAGDIPPAAATGRTVADC